MTTKVPLAQLDIAGVISRTLSTLGENFLGFFLLGLVFAGIPTMLVQYAIEQFITPQFFSNADVAVFSWLSMLVGIGSFIVLLLPTYILIGGVTHGSILLLNGRRVTFRESLAVGIERVLPLMALGFLTTLGIVLGLVFFIIPGVILATRWAIAAPALVVERRGIADALSRSSELARDNRWRIFWLLLIWVGLNFVLEFAFASLVGMLAGALSQFGEHAIWVYLAIYAVYSALSSIIAAAGAATLYTDLRTIKEGPSTEDLAKIFE